MRHTDPPLFSSVKSTAARNFEDGLTYACVPRRRFGAQACLFSTDGAAQNPSGILDKEGWMGDKKLMRTMGLDIGSRTIGVAISDELEITAQGLKTIRRKSSAEDLRELTAIIQQFDIKKIVVGLPKNMDGSIGKQAEIILRWIKSHQEKITLPMVTWDERLSTIGASRVLLEADLSRQKRKGVIDKLAAMFILQGYLDHTRNRTNEAIPST